MLVWLFALCVLAPQESDPDPMATGQALLRDGEYFVAEGYFLNVEPTENEVVPLAKALAEIALRLDGADEKQAFYKSQLIRSQNWRLTALLTLACMQAHERQWPELVETSRVLFQDLAFEDPIKHRLLYWLARYTDAAPAEFELNAADRAWFDACRALPADRRFPSAIAADWPAWQQQLHLLDETEPFDVPPLPADAAPLDRYRHGLLQIRDALNRGDDNAAALAINRVNSLDREFRNGALRALYYPLLQAFYQLRGQEDAAAVMARNLARVRDWALLPYVVLPEHISSRTTVDIQPEPEPETRPTTVPDRPESEPAAEPEPAAAEPDAGKPLTFERLETMLLAGQRGLELTIKAKRTDTDYKKIYQNYLLGLHYLKGDRLDRAFERLQLARRFIVDFPFPNLECKILLALGDYFEAKAEASQEDSAKTENRNLAEWRRIDAVQIWNAPEHMPIFVHHNDAPQRSPYGILIDRALRQVAQPEALNKLLYYSELGHFVGLRKRAYLRRALSANAVLDNQFQQIGAQLHQLVRSLAENPATESTPRRYNNALDLWNQLWGQTHDYYRNQSTPSIAEVQRALTQRERVISFVEGDQLLGVLVISKEQAFAVGLGAKRNFDSLSPDKQFEFLEGRLGPLWTQNGGLILDVSPTLLEHQFITRLKNRMARSEQLRVVFSLKSHLAPKTRSACRNFAVFSENQTADVGQLVQSLPPAGLVWLAGEDATPRAMAAELERHDHVIYLGPLQLTDDGLAMGPEGRAFPLHQIMHRNDQLCSLTLASDSFKNWNAALPELELIDPAASLFILLLEDSARIEPGLYNRAANGLRLP